MGNFPHRFEGKFLLLLLLLFVELHPFPSLQCKTTSCHVPFGWRRNLHLLHFCTCRIDKCIKSGCLHALCICPALVCIVFQTQNTSASQTIIPFCNLYLIVIDLIQMLPFRDAAMKLGFLQCPHHLYQQVWTLN